MQRKCDICGNELTMLAGGKGAACKVCGMEHSVERIREMLQEDNQNIVSTTEKVVEEIDIAHTDKERKVFDVVEFEIVDGDVRADETEQELTESTDSDFVMKKSWGMYELQGYRGNAQRVIFPEYDIAINKHIFDGHDEIVELVFSGGYHTEGEDGVFAGLKNLQKIICYDGVVFGNKEFFGCKNLQKLVVEDAHSICFPGEETFANCINLNKIFFDFNASIDIGVGTFKNCTSLEELVMPTNYESMVGDGIKSKAFENCISLRNIVLPDNVKAIHKDAFKNCTALEIVTTHSGGLSSVAIHPEAFSGASFQPENVGICPICGQDLVCTDTELNCYCGFEAFQQLDG